jgi:hypothetical protein
MAISLNVKAVYPIPFRSSSTRGGKRKSRMEKGVVSWIVARSRLSMPRYCGNRDSLVGQINT